MKNTEVHIKRIEKMKKGKAIIVLCFILLAAYFYAHVEKPELLYDKSITGSEYLKQDLCRGEVSQEFVCQEDSLDAVQIKCQPCGEIKDIALRMTLTDLETGDILAKAELAPGEMENGKFNTFSFEKIQNTKGKSYKAVFEGTGTEVFEQPDGTLIMKTITERFDIETFCVLLVIVGYITAFFAFLIKLFSR